VQVKNDYFPAAYTAVFPTSYKLIINTQTDL